MKNFIHTLFIIGICCSCSARYHVTSYQGNSTLEVDSSFAIAANLEATIASYRGMLNQKMNRKIGTATTDITKSPGEGENALGNFAADLLQAQSNIYFGDSIDMSIQNFGGLRVNINKGDIYVRNIYELMPFDNLITIMTLKGSAIKKLFEYQGKTKGLAIANTQLVYDKDGNLKEATIGGEKFDIQKNYTISISDYLANGGGNMEFLAEAIHRIDSEILMRDAMIGYVERMTQAGKIISAKIENRVVFEDE